jgi:alkanesulfonate monooxygenase SsuD/methylene tetrahydromethanopterin reductase-like flavin-dependent oxidoreductase (luciferase family)
MRFGCHLPMFNHLSNGRVILGAGVGWMREEIVRSRP